MYEVDFLPVGDGERSGDAIAVRFTKPGTDAIAHVIIDAGFQATTAPRAPLLSPTV